jgi:hypothetical protein
LEKSWIILHFWVINKTMGYFLFILLFYIIGHIHDISYQILGELWTYGEKYPCVASISAHLCDSNFPLIQDLPL